MGIWERSRQRLLEGTILDPTNYGEGTSGRERLQSCQWSRYATSALAAEVARALMCDELAATLRDLKSKNVPVSAITEQRWGTLATLTLPSGSKLGIYQPKHPSPKRR